MGERKLNKLSADRADIVSERDLLNGKCANLERIICDNREAETDALNEQMTEMQADNAALRKENNLLKKAEAKLRGEYEELDAVYNLEKEAFKDAIEKTQIDAHFRDNESVRSDRILDVEQNEKIRQMREQMNK